MSSIDIIEVELTPLDQLYYVSRESGDDFSTRPYVMHTALYYAFGLLPSRYRVCDQTPQYISHFEAADVANDLYIHPATTVDRVAGQYTTRRFSVKADKFRQRSEQENKNLKETGFQRFIDPETTFRTFVRVDQADAESITSQIEGYCRIGKKMTSTRVRTAHHRTELTTGEFTLGHPIGNVDIDTDRCEIVGDVHLEAMMPVNVITDARLCGDHVTIEPEFGASRSSVSLPANTEFLLQQQ